MLYDGLRDCVIFGIKDTDFIFAAVYIPPSNSIYFDNICFENLNLIYNKFKSYRLYIMGDLNSRVGKVESNNPKYKYVDNPDTVINENGRKLLAWLYNHNDMFLLNGLCVDGVVCDSKFTFHRGTNKSQIDFVISNNIDNISFDIHRKQIYSDHCPVSFTCEVSPGVSLELIHECSKGLLDYDHYDINKRKLPPIDVDRVDWLKAIPTLIDESRKFQEVLTDGTHIDNNVYSIKLSSTIYNTCRRSYKGKSKPVEIPPLPNCTSKNYKAIAEINLFTYETHIQNGIPFEQCKTYFENWAQFETLARQAEHNEFNTKINTAWKKAKNDGKSLWKLIDWDGKAEKKQDVVKIGNKEIQLYFKNIFQAKETRSHPTTSDVQQRVNEYDIYVPALDKEPQRSELDLAIRTIGKGVALDGLPGDVIKMLPPEVVDMISVLMKKVFLGQYPKEWEKQILHALPKPGHTVKSPKLRGISVAPVFARLYDGIMQNRFSNWYVPNREQAGFRSGQVCLLQIFVVFLLIDYAKEKKRNLLIGFMDYAKAFDYANRAHIITDLMKNGCGKRFLQAITKMFNSTTYIPEVGRNKLGDEIKTRVGVAQGRKTSPDFYSFYVSDMPLCMEDIPNDDFMDPYNIVQLADDTIILAEHEASLIRKFDAALTYSSGKFQIPNIKKTVYAHFSRNPSTNPILIRDGVTFDSIDKVKGHCYLGVTFLPTDDVREIITKNINDRSGNICKFYAWLEANEETPIEVKMLILDNCLFTSLLYGIETWGNFECIHANLRSIEMKALKSILKVKKGTSTDLVYYELRRPDIVSRIKDRQYKFFKKLSESMMIMRWCNPSCKSTMVVPY